MYMSLELRILWTVYYKTIGDGVVISNKNI